MYPGTTPHHGSGRSVTYFPDQETETLGEQNSLWSWESSSPCLSLSNTLPTPSPATCRPSIPAPIWVPVRRRARVSRKTGWGLPQNHTGTQQERRSPKSQGARDKGHSSEAEGRQDETGAADSWKGGSQTPLRCRSGGLSSVVPAYFSKVRALGSGPIAQAAATGGSSD